MVCPGAARNGWRVPKARRASVAQPDAKELLKVVVGGIEGQTDKAAGPCPGWEEVADRERSRQEQIDVDCFEDVGRRSVPVGARALAGGESGGRGHGLGSLRAL